MVEFFSSRLPQQQAEYIISHDTTNNRLLLEAEPRLARNSVAYWMDSDESLKYTLAGDKMASVVAEQGGLYLASAVIQTGGGIIGADDPDTYEETVIARAQQKGPATLLGVTADFPQELKIESYNETTYNNEKIEEAIIDWVKNNKDRVTLGYGPEHVLDDIQPLAVSDDYIPRNDPSVLSNFNNWVSALIERTATTGNEHAFYVDENNNCIGVVSGGKSSVTYPSAKRGSISVTAHTHPTMKSLAFPSETDLRTSSFRCTENSVEMIALANYHSNFVFDREADNTDRIEEATADHPYTKAPVLLIEQDKAQTEQEIKQHHTNQIPEITQMLDRQLQHKRQGIDRVEPQMSDAAFMLLESEYDKATKLRDKLIEENKATETLTGMGTNDMTKFTLSQEMLSL